MKLLYILPGNIKLGLGEAEMHRRCEVLRQHAFPGTEVEITYAESGPPSIESIYEKYVASTGVIEKVMQAEKDGYDGVIVGCFGDPGLEGAREVATIPVVGPGESSMHLAAMLGYRFSIIIPTASLAASTISQVRNSRMLESFASARASNVSVLDINRDPRAAEKKAIEAGWLAVEADGADCLLLGCMSLAFAGVDKPLAKALGIPVINPATASLKVLESMVAMGVSHSKLAYGFPPKMVRHQG